MGERGTEREVSTINLFVDEVTLIPWASNKKWSISAGRVVQSIFLLLLVKQNPPGRNPALLGEPTKREVSPPAGI